MSLEPHKRLGKYELQQRLGHGGMAEVWKALDTQLQRYVAIKLLHANLQADPNFVTRFQREAQVIASLHHPNIVQIHDFQVSEPPESETQIFYMVMSYIEGSTLATYISATSAQRKIPSPIEMVNLFTSISLAVDYAHEKGMIHRDIKPANILLDAHNRTRNIMGEPILTDFGLAKLLGVSASTMTGTALGTPIYTSPEQAQGYIGNERSDLYSLGVILYEMVTGVPPFRGENPTAVLAQHLHATPPPPALFNPNIPPALTIVIMTALAKDPNARFSRASVMTAAMAESLNVPVPESLGHLAHQVDARNASTSISQSQPGFPPSAAGSMATPFLGLSSPLFSSPVSGTAQPLVASSGGANQALSEKQVSLPLTPVFWQPSSGAPSAGPATTGGSTGVVQEPQAPEDPGISTTGTTVLLPPNGPQRRSWRGLYTVLVALVLLVLLGSGLGAYFILSPGHVAPAAVPGGQAFFVSSEQLRTGSAQGIADELQIELHNIPAPASGKSYYAWLLPDRHPYSEPDPLQPPPEFSLPLKMGPLPFSHGTISYLYQGTSQEDNLISLASRLLITEEDTNGTQLGPTADRSAWQYYAEIPQTPYGAGSNPLSALDHIRHLFYKEARTSALGLGGGLDIWLYRNTEKVMEWSISARDDYRTDLTNSSVLHGLFLDMLGYLDGAPNVSIDVPGGFTDADPAARVALLSVVPTQVNKTDLPNDPPGYVDHMALHLNGVVQAPDATPRMRAISVQIIQSLNHAKTWLQQVRAYAQQLVLMNAAQLSQPSTLTMLNNMLTYATYAYIGQLDPNTNQSISGVLQVHYDVQQLAALTVTSQLPKTL